MERIRHIEISQTDLRGVAEKHLAVELKLFAQQICQNLYPSPSEG